jgi:hypothetical protein
LYGDRRVKSGHEPDDLTDRADDDRDADLERLKDLASEAPVIRLVNRHPRWTFHFTPTSGSWLNAVGSFFSELARKRMRRGSFHSLVDLQAAIKSYPAKHNAQPKPFVWTTWAASILAKPDRLTAQSELIRVLARFSTDLTSKHARHCSLLLSLLHHPCIRERGNRGG